MSGFGYDYGSKSQMGDRQRKLDERYGPKKETPPAKKKGGRPKGSKNKAK